MFLYIVKRFNGRISIKTTNNINNIKINKDSILYDVYQVDDEFRLKDIGNYLCHSNGVICIKNTNYLVQLESCSDIKSLIDKFFNL